MCVPWTAPFVYKGHCALPLFALFTTLWSLSLSCPSPPPSSPPTMAAETVDKATLDKQAVNVLNHSMWSKKQYYILLGALLVQSFIYAFETNLMYGVIGHVTAIFTSASLTAILPTILQILSASLVPFYSKFADVIGRPGALTIAMTFYVTGYIIQGTSNGFTQFSVGQAFYSIGVPGFMVLTQVLVVGMWT